MKKTLFYFSTVPVMAILLFGCAPKAEPDKPLSEVRAEAAQMSSAELKKMSAAYEQSLMKKRRQFEDLKNEAKRLSAQEVFGQKGESIKERLSAVKNEITELSLRQRIYLDQIQESAK